jgi:hypothetical protein
MISQASLGSFASAEHMPPQRHRGIKLTVKSGKIGAIGIIGGMASKMAEDRRLQNEQRVNSSSDDRSDENQVNTAEIMPQFRAGKRRQKRKQDGRASATVGRWGERKSREPSRAHVDVPDYGRGWADMDRAQCVFDSQLPEPPAHTFG